MFDIITVVESNDIVDCLSKHGSETFKVSISIRRDGLSFFLSNNESKTIKCLAEYKSVVDVFTLENIDIILDSFIKKIPEILKFSINVIIHNNMFTLVPDEFYSELKAKDYIEFVLGDIESGYDIAVNKVSDLQVIFLYPISIVNSLRRCFGVDISVSHSATKSIAYGVDNHIEGCVMYVDISSANVEITMFNNQRFIYYNTFEYTNNVDILYYIMTIISHKGFDSEEVKVHVMGIVDNDIEEVLNMSLTNLIIKK